MGKSRRDEPGATPAKDRRRCRSGTCATFCASTGRRLDALRAVSLARVRLGGLLSRLETVAVPVVLAIAGAGCGKPVTARDLVGTWVITRESRTHLPAAFRESAAEIVFRADGTFSADELPGEGSHSTFEMRPEWLSGTPNGPPRLITGSGLWKLESGVDRQHWVELSFLAVRGVKSSDLPFGAQLIPARAGSAPILPYYEGDPDESRVIEFERR